MATLADVLDPTGLSSARATDATLAPRPRGPVRAAHRAAGEHQAQRRAAARRAGRPLEREHGARAVLRRTKTAFALPMPDELREEFLAECDVVLVGVGDCGSCSASAVADGIAFERSGVPAAVICSDAFTVTASSMAAVQGAPDYAFLTTAHPVAILTPRRSPSGPSSCCPRSLATVTDRAGQRAGLVTAQTDLPAADPDAARAAMEHCYEQGWSDGLPLVPATRPLVDEFLATVDRRPDEVIGALEHLDRSVTVEVAAINAAMAGCRPEYFPVVLAAWEAVQRDRSAKGGGWQSTSGPSPLLVVNGPVRAELGFNSAGGVFGPGFRPNMTIARSIGLIVRNALGVVPHGFEQATQGLPGRWQVCVAENEEESPWEPLSVDGGVPAGTSAVSAMLTAHGRVRRQPAHRRPRAAARRLRRHHLAQRRRDLPARTRRGSSSVPSTRRCWPRPG